MPSYHSKLNDDTTITYTEACGCALLPFSKINDLIKSTSNDTSDSGDKVNKIDDIIDETMSYYRANAMFRNFPVRTAIDRTLIYITLYIQLCLVKCEKFDDIKLASKELTLNGMKPFCIPGENGWQLGGIFSNPKTSEEADAFRSYFKKLRDEIGHRVINVLYNGPNNTKNKWWQAFSKRKFMQKELKE